jgi:parvulin-like peptidyl-prolyl isomerase
MATPLSNLQERSRAPILPGLLEDEEDQDEKSKVSHAPTGAAALPRNQPSTANQSAGSSAPEKSGTGGSPRQPAEAARKKEETEVVARVGKRVLTLADARKRVMAFQGMARGDIDDPEYHRAVRAVAEEWSRQVAMAEEARTRKISVGDRDTSATRANWSDQLGRNPEEVLAAAGFTKEEIQREFTERALARKLVETFFSVRYNDAGLRELYRRSPGRFAPPKFYHLREILIPAAGEVGSESDARAREQAEAVAASARQAGADFPALAARFSRAPTARNGGDLGWFDRSNPAPQAVLDAVRGLNKGEVSAPVRDDEGWRIYQVVDSQTPEASFEVVRDQVAALGRELAEKAALEASQAKHKPQVTLQALPSRAEAIASALAETPAAAEAVAGTAVFQASDGTAAPDDSMTQESSPVGPTRRTSAGATAAASGRPAASATGRRTLRSTSEDLATPIPLDSQSPKVGGLPNLLARVQGQSPDASSARNDQPVNNTVTQRLEDGTQIRASVSVRPRTTAPTTPPRGTGDAVAALPASMRAMGHALLDRAGLTGTEPPAQNLAFINIGPNGSGGAPADSSVQGGSQIPDLSPAELKAAINGPAGGSLRDGQGQSDVTEEYRGRVSDRTSGNRSGGIGPESGKQIPKGFGEQKDRSVVDLAGETVMKPVQAVRGVVGGALGLLKRDNNRSKR